MIRLFPAQRRAERFDRMVEGGRHDHVDRRDADLLELVGALRSVPEAQARPEFVADLRERLMVAAETELVATPAAARRLDEVERLTVKPRRTRNERRLGVALGAVAIIGATTSLAVASQSAIPGDALYPLKRAIENTQAGFSVGDDAKGETILGNASGRLDEIDELTSGSDPDAALVRDTLNTFSDQATEAGDLLMADYEQNGHEESIEALHHFTTQSMGILGDLEAAIPSSAHDALLNAARALFTLDQAADQVCPDPACGDGITEVPPQLLSAGAGAVEDLTGTAAGELPGTDASGDGGQNGDSQITDGGKGDNPSGMNPPESPITIPSTPVDTSGVTDPIGSLLPSTDATSGSGSGSGGKHKPKPKPVDVVTTTVDDVVTGVVDGVNEVLGGLTGTN
jgi:hypothetical protein